MLFLILFDGINTEYRGHMLQYSADLLLWFQFFIFSLFGYERFDLKMTIIDKILENWFFVFALILIWKISSQNGYNKQNAWWLILYQ